MDIVTITDHDSIDGWLELIDRVAGRQRHPDGRRGVVPLPGRRHRGPPRRVRHHRSGCTRDPAAAAERVRRDRRACGTADVFFALNHLLHFYRGQAAAGRVSAAALRGSGARGAGTGRCSRAHNLLVGAPGREWSAARRRWRASAGSDAHTLRRVGRTWTEAPGSTRGGVPGQPARRPRPAGRPARRRAGRRRRRLRRDRALHRQRLRLRAARSCGLAPRRLRACDRRVAAGAVPAGGRGGGRANRAKRRDRRGRARRRSARWPRRPRRWAGVPRSTQHDARRVAITGIGHGHARSARRAKRTGANLVAGKCGIGPLTVFDSDGYRSRIAAEVPTRQLDARLTPLQRRRWSRSDQFGMRRRHGGASTTAACSDAASTRSRVGVLLGACTADLLRTERYLETMLTKRHRAARPSDVWNHFQHAGRHHRRRIRLRRAALVHRRRLRVEHDGDRQRRRRHPAGRLDAALAGGTDACCAADVQRLQRAQA